jgi:uncharacterized phiE125 gp8 family phage protein
MVRRFFTPSDPASGPVVPLEDMKLHIRRDDDDDNDVILAAEQAAVRYIEGRTNRLIPARSATLRLPELPCGRLPIELPGGEVHSLDSVTINGVAHDVSEFEVLGKSPARLIPSEDWPTVEEPESFPVEVVYTVGYSSVPADLVHAIKLMAGHFYENREAVAIGTIATAIPFAVDALISRHRTVPR